MRSGERRNGTNILLSGIRNRKDEIVNSFLYSYFEGYVFFYFFIFIFSGTVLKN